MTVRALAISAIVVGVVASSAGMASGAPAPIPQPTPAGGFGPGPGFGNPFATPLPGGGTKFGIPALDFLDTAGGVVVNTVTAPVYSYVHPEDPDTIAHSVLGGLGELDRKFWEWDEQRRKDYWENGGRERGIAIVENNNRILQGLNNGGPGLLSNTPPSGPSQQRGGGGNCDFSSVEQSIRQQQAILANIQRDNSPRDAATERLVRQHIADVQASINALRQQEAIGRQQMGC